MWYTYDMKKETLIKEIFNQNALSYSYIETGLTNDNYIVTLADSTIVLRVPRSEHKHLFDYHHEAKVLDLIKPLNLDTPLIYYNKDTGVKCNAFIENSETFQPKYIKRAATLIKTLHSANIVSGKSFDIKQKLMQYHQGITDPLYDVTFAFAYFDSIDTSHQILCHNDLVQGNLLFTEAKDYLIDYEYAADNDPYFDIMSFITENDIVDTELRALFYDSYFGSTPSKAVLTKLKHYEIIHHTLWCTWAMNMYETFNDVIYKDIAHLKYKRLMEMDLVNS